MELRQSAGEETEARCLQWSPAGSKHCLAPRKPWTWGRITVTSHQDYKPKWWGWTRKPGKLAGWKSYLSLSHRTSEDTALEGPTASKPPGSPGLSFPSAHWGNQCCLPHHAVCQSLGGNENVRVLGRRTSIYRKEHST